MRVGLFIMAGLVLLLSWACENTDQPKCSESKSCPSGLVCVNGLCEKKRCNIDEQCDFNEYCDTRTRECRRKSGPAWTCQSSADCRTGESCVSGFCRIANSEPTPIPDTPPPVDVDPNVCSPACQADETCEKGTCMKLPEDPACKLDQDCPTGLFCNFGVDRCQKKCQSNADCPEKRICKEQFCQYGTASGCSASQPCPSGKTCQNGACVDAPECGPQKACPTGKVCKDGKCIDEPKPECDAQTPCPTGKTCQGGKCVERGQSCGPGTSCPTGQKCWKSQCVSEDYCEQASDCQTNEKCFRNLCNACAQDSDCPTHMSCVQSTCQFVKKQPGEECVASTQCISTAVCMGDGSGTQYCRTRCTPGASNTGCAANEGCVLLSDKVSGACLPKKGAGALTAGQTCNPNNVQCEVDLICVNTGNSNVCMALCNIQQQNCASGAKCVSLGIDPIGGCEASGSTGGGGENSPCTSQSQCQSGLKCLRLSSGQGVCTPTCSPSNTSCSAGKVCDLIMDYAGKDLQEAVCGPLISGVGEGQLCNYNYHISGSCPPNQPNCLCRSDLFCFLNQQNPSAGLCARPCDPVTKRCPAGKTCLISPLTYKGQNLYGCI